MRQQSSRVRALAIFATLGITAVALAGCSTSGGSGGSDSNTLTLVTSQKAQTQPLIDGFEKANPGTTINATYIDDDSAYQQQLRTQLSAGTAPDVFKVWPGGANSSSVWTLAKAGTLADISSSSWASQVPSTEATVSSLDGKLYAVPANTGGIGAIYNDQAMAALGQTPPTTWSGVLALCSAAKSAGKVAFALGNKDAWTAQMIPYALTSSLVYGPNPDFVNQQEAGTASFSDSKWKQALDQTQQMVAAGCFNDGPNGTSYDQQMKMVGSGDALAAVQVSQAVPTSANTTAGTTFTIAAFPATDNAADTYMPTSIGVSFAENAKAKNSALAQKFLDYVASPEGQTIFAQSTSSAPALTASSDFKPDSTLTGIIAAQEAGKVSAYPDTAWPNTNVSKTYLIDLQEFFGGTLDASTFLQQMDSAFTGN